MSGSFAFQVGTGGGVDQTAFLDSLGAGREATSFVRWAHTAARWIAFLGIVLLLGS
ncbi:MAG: hypothetical protein RLZ04_2331, partial [Actinomycetota bacterium]